jgi:hypothetical protein
MKKVFVLLVLLLPSLAAFGQQKALTLEEAVNEWVLGMNEALPEAKVAVISIDSPDTVIAEDIINLINVAITQTNSRTKK